MLQFEKAAFPMLEQFLEAEGNAALELSEAKSSPVEKIFPVRQCFFIALR